MHFDNKVDVLYTLSVGPSVYYDLYPVFVKDKLPMRILIKNGTICRFIGESLKFWSHNVPDLSCNIKNRYILIFRKGCHNKNFVPYNAKPGSMIDKENSKTNMFRLAEDVEPVIGATTINDLVVSGRNLNRCRRDQIRIDSIEDLQFIQEMPPATLRKTILLNTIDGICYTEFPNYETLYITVTNSPGALFDFYPINRNLPIYRVLVPEHTILKVSGQFIKNYAWSSPRYPCVSAHINFSSPI